MRLLTLFAVSLIIFACASEPGSDWKARDLTGYNIPISIMVPDSAVIEANNLSGIMQDVTIESKVDDYSVQVLANQASTSDMAKLKSEQLELVRDNRYFSRIISEEPTGFIFENQIDSTSIYGFRYIIYQGDQQFVFQNGFNGTFGLLEIERMYSAVKQDK
ncbi:MAG: hypothetical protein ACJAZ9_000359 [Neolewinella sp.]|jgi:hypothetical protein